VFGTLVLQLLGADSFRMFAAGRLVLLLFLGSYGTLVAVSSSLMMPLYDSDIPMNVPCTFRNKQPLPPPFPACFSCWLLSSKHDPARRQEATMGLAQLCTFINTSRASRGKLLAPFQ
jgi:hypothetical protein